MEIIFEKSIASLADTKKVAHDISQLLNGKNIVVLNGNLGAGKTTTVKFICDYFNISNVNSPSFAIVNEYEGDRKIFHFDFYRIKKIDELYDIGFEEYLNDEEALIFIEWGNLFPEILPRKYYEIQFEIKTNNHRTIKMLKIN